MNLESKIVVWTLGGCFFTATTLFIGKIVMALQTAVTREIERFRDYIVSGAVLEDLGVGLLDVLKALGGALFGH